MSFPPSSHVAVQNMMVTVGQHIDGMSNRELIVLAEDLTAQIAHYSAGSVGTPRWFVALSDWVDDVVEERGLVQETADGRRILVLPEASR